MYFCHGQMQDMFSQACNGEYLYIDTRARRAGSDGSMSASWAARQVM